MSGNESANTPIQIGDTLISADSKILILDYDLETDTYYCDLFNKAGKLLRHNRTLDGDLVRTIFRKL